MLRARPSQLGPPNVETPAKPRKAKLATAVATASALPMVVFM
jgi:hypothetical protein